MYKYRGGENANYIKQEKTPWYCHCYIHAADNGWCAII